MNFPHSPSFMVGFLNGEDLPKEQLPAAREHVTAVYHWLQEVCDPEEEQSGERAHWRPTVEGKDGEKPVVLPGLGLASQRMALLIRDTLNPAATEPALEAGIEVRVVGDELESLSHLLIAFQVGSDFDEAPLAAYSVPVLILPVTDGEPYFVLPPDSEGTESQQAAIDLMRIADLITQYGDKTEAIEPCLGRASTLLFGEVEGVEKRLTEPAQEFIRQLEPVAQEQQQSTILKRRLGREAMGKVSLLALFTFLAAFFFTCFSQWDLEGADVESVERSYTTLFLFLSLISFAFAAIFYLSHRASRGNAVRYLAGALSEAFRIQFFRSVSGIGTPLAYGSTIVEKAVRSLNLHRLSWRDAFQELPNSDQSAMLRATVSGWIQDQLDDISAQGRRLATLIHRQRNFGWGLIWTGVVQVAGMALWKMIRPQDDGTFLGGVALALLLAFAVMLVITLTKDSLSSSEAKSAQSDSDEEPRESDGVLELLLEAGMPGLIIGLSGLIVSLVAIVPDLGSQFPSAGNVWAILTVATLVGGILSFAWADKLALREQLKHVARLRGLYREALGEIKSRGESMAEGDSAGIQTVLETLGSEVYAEALEALPCPEQEELKIQKMFHRSSGAASKGIDADLVNAMVRKRAHRFGRWFWGETPGGEG